MHYMERGAGRREEKERGEEEGERIKKSGKSLCFSTDVNVPKPSEEAILMYVSQLRSSFTQPAPVQEAVSVMEQSPVVEAPPPPQREPTPPQREPTPPQREPTPLPSPQKEVHCSHVPLNVITGYTACIENYVLNVMATKHNRNYLNSYICHLFV